MLAYQDYVVRSRITEALIAGSSAKGYMSEAFQNDSVVGMTNATSINERSSKYIQDVKIVEGTPWTISLIISATLNNGIPIALDGNQINFSPNVQGITPIPNSMGAIDWACTSADNETATARGLANRAIPTVKPLPTTYAPSECR